MGVGRNECLFLRVEAAASVIFLWSGCGMELDLKPSGNRPERDEEAAGKGLTCCGHVFQRDLRRPREVDLKRKRGCGMSCSGASR